MSLDIEDTIVAIASAPGQAMRGIVRVSGPQTVAVVGLIFDSFESDSLAKTLSQAPRKLTSALSGKLILEDGIALPGELLVWPTNKSFTRQPTAEFHTIGSSPLLQSAVKAICKAGARIAEPGEFTLRAFLSGRIDLTQAEAVLAVIDSTGEEQMDTALRQLAGGLAGPLGEIRRQLIGTLAELEAGLDFVEEDIEFISKSELKRQLLRASTNLDKVAQQINARDIDSGSIKVVLYGLPNSGKSSLFNALTNSESAIVTQVAGTTTDFVSASVEIGSNAIEVVDTAGIEASVGSIKTQSQSQRETQQQQALVRLLCIDSSKPSSEWEVKELKQAAPNTLVVLTKSDLDQSNDISKQTELPFVITSSVTSTGLDQLRDQIELIVAGAQPAETSVVGSTVLRASESLRESQRSLEHAISATQGDLGEEIVAAEIRLALQALGQVVGTVYTDDILDLVFGKFCIGK